MAARRPAGYAVAMEVARRAEGPEVNGDLRKTVSRRSLVPSRELERKGYLFLGVAAKTTRDKAPYSEERGVSAVSTERIKEWKRSESGENENSSRETSYHG